MSTCWAVHRYRGFIELIDIFIMVPKSKSQSILFQILKALKEKRPKDARIGFDKILSNHESARAEMGQTDKNLLIVWSKINQETTRA